MQRESAQIIALQALGWLASDDELFQTFLGATGASAGDASARAQDAEFQAAILEFLLMNDAWVIGFCDAVGISYTVPMEAQVTLLGGPHLHWT
jgi:Protein of unknown function (DUF3572)